MKNKDKINFRKSTIQDLKKEIEVSEGKLRKMRVDRHVKEMKNSREGKSIRKRIAVLLTYVNERQLSES